MHTFRKHFLALWRGALAADSPWSRRAWGLFVALLPLSIRRRLLRLAALWTSAPTWLVGILSFIGGYLVMSAGALLVLWLWSRAGALVCSDRLKPSCAPIHTDYRTEIEAG